MSRTYYTADVEDPVTGRTQTLAAEGEEELERLVDQHLAGVYSEPPRAAGG